LITFVSAIAVLSLLTLIHEVGHLLLAKWAGLQVDEFGLGYPPRLCTLARRGGTDYTLNLILFGAFVRLPEEGTVSNDLASLPRSARAMFLLGGPLFNILLATALLSVCFISGWPIAHDRAVGVDEVTPGSVAEAVGFQTGDMILAADDQRVSSVLELIVHARSVHGDIRKVTIRRRGQLTSLNLPAGRPWFIKPESRGVLLRNDAGWVEIRAYPWYGAIANAFASTIRTVSSLLALPIRVLQGSIPVDMVRPVGPVGLAQLTGQAAQQVAASGWWFPILQLTATMSAALAATNLVPLPGLDGGRLLFVLVEAVRGKQFAAERENLVHLAGLVVMLALILIVTYYDIASPFPFAP